MKNFYDTQAWLPKNAMIVNKKAFDALDKATQDAVLKAAAEAETRGWKLSEEKTGWYPDQLKKNGMNVAPPSPQLKSRSRQGRRDDAQGVARQGGQRRQGRRRRVPQDVTRA